MTKLKIFIVGLFTVFVNINLLMAQTANTSPLPAGATIIGEHLHVGASNEIWTDASSLYFNYRGTGSSTFFWDLGGDSGKPIMSLLNNGNVGIGTTTPNANLQIGNSFSEVGTQTVRICTPAGGIAGTVVDAIHIDTPNSGVYNQGVAISLGLKNSVYGTYTSRIVHYGNAANTRATKLQLQTHSSYPEVWNTGILIDENGYVGIGTATPDQALTVNGTIHAKEVNVTVDVPADYVFKPTYKLMPLNQVEQYVKTNNHLPEIPSAG
jgi:hypothetical protein